MMYVIKLEPDWSQTTFCYSTMFLSGRKKPFILCYPIRSILPHLTVQCILEVSLSWIYKYYNLCSGIMWAVLLVVFMAKGHFKPVLQWLQCIQLIELPILSRNRGCISYYSITMALTNCARATHCHKHCILCEARSYKQ